MWISQFFFNIGVGVSAYCFISLLKSFLLHVKLFVLSKCGYRKEDFAKKYGSWAGASAGIGLAYAKELASRKMNIVLISCEAEDLKRIAAEIESEFTVQSKIICVDFTSGQHVYEVIQKELRGLQIGILGVSLDEARAAAKVIECCINNFLLHFFYLRASLVNNVGIYESPTFIHEMTADTMRKMVLVNCIPVVTMTRFVLPGMKENGRGAIVNVSSMVESTPTPTLGLYAATKAFTTAFTKALQFENRGSGVTIQIVSPGTVNTFTTKTMFLEKGRKPLSENIIFPCPTDFVRQAIGTLGILDHTAGYRVHSLLVTILEMMPVSLRMYVIGYLLLFLKKILL